MKSLRALVVLALVFGGAVLLVAGCGFDPEATEAVRCPDWGAFDEVSPALERRCGSAKCHGRPGKNYRILSAFGLRLDPRDKLGTPETTAAEVSAHFESLCLLEPELMSNVVLGRAEPSALLLVRKPKLVEAHKGKKVIQDGDNLERCLTTWLHGSADASACDNARFEH